MVRVLHVSAAAERGGLEVILFNTLNALDRSRFLPSVLFLDDGPFLKEVQNTGTDVWLVKSGHVRNIVRLRQTVAETARLIKEHGIALVHTHNAKAQVYGGLAAASVGIPCVYHLHGVPVPAFSRTGILSALSVAVPARRTIACSAYVAGAFHHHWRSTRPIDVVHGGITITQAPVPAGTPSVRAEFGIPEECRLVLMACRLQHQKGVHVFLDAAARVRQVSPEIRFMVVGGTLFGLDRGYAVALQEQAARLQLTSLVTFTGYRPDIYRFLEVADVVVHSSVEPDSFPTVLLEAMALGRPVIASDLGGPREIIDDGRTGLLVPPKDAGALADAIIRTLGRADHGVDLGRAGAERFNTHFRAERMTGRVERIYDEMVTDPARPSTSPRGRHRPRRRALLVCAPSPRLAGSAPVGTVKLVRAMLDADWDIDILACRFEKASVVDPFFSRLLDGASLYEGNSLFEKPSTWVPRAVWTGRALLAKRSYDVLLTLAHLTWTHVVGLGLGRQRRPPWVAYFSDPWSNHPLPKISPLRRRMERAFERRTLDRADALVFTHERMRDYILGPHEEQEALHSKSFAIPYFFDAGLYPTKGAHSASTKLLMRHMGTIPVGGYFQKVLEAIRLLNAERPPLGRRLCVEFYGVYGDAHRSIAAALGLNDQISFHPAVSYPDSLRLMRESALLLFLGVPPGAFRGLGNATLHLKLADYIGADRPIFLMAGRGSPAHETLGNTNGFCAEEDPARIKTVLSAFIDAPELPPRAALTEFSKDRVYQIWERVFDRVSKGPAQSLAQAGASARTGT